MEVIPAYKGNKNFRLLNMYERLTKGEVLFKASLAVQYGVSEKTIQRDIDDLRSYLAEEHQFETEVAIQYDRKKQGYYMVRFEREWLTNQELLAVCKILLESRALELSELNQLMTKLLAQVAPNDRNIVEKLVRNEWAYYVPLRHGQKLLNRLWELSQHIVANQVIRFSYTRKDGVERDHSVKPAAILFSDFYFYLIAFLTDDSRKYPTVFRVDRISHLVTTGELFITPYQNEFSEGEFRKRVQFMYSGVLEKVTFEFCGDSVEAVLDRLPTAEIIEEKDGKYIIKAESFGPGIYMWCRSQGDRLRLL